MVSPVFPGILRVWEAATAACVHSQAVPFTLREEPSERSLSQCQFVPARNEILTVSMEHNILFYDAQSLQLRKQVTALSLPVPLSMLQDQLCSWKKHQGRPWLQPVLGLFHGAREFHCFGGNVAQRRAQEGESRTDLARNASCV